jgi:hypothetical protein
VPHPFAYFAEEPALSLPKGWETTTPNQPHPDFLSSHVPHPFAHFAKGPALSLPKGWETTTPNQPHSDFLSRPPKTSIPV